MQSTANRNKLTPKDLLFNDIALSAGEIKTTYLYLNMTKFIIHNT